MNRCLGLIVFVLVFTSASAAHETDQFTTPAGREFADLGAYFNRWAYGILREGVARANANIRRAIVEGQPATVVGALQAPDRLVMAVHSCLPWSVNEIEDLERTLASPRMRERYPGRIVSYSDRWGGMYRYAFSPLDLRQFSHLFFFASTIKVYGTFLGTDKIGHFGDEGIDYYFAFRAAQNRGAGERDAIAAAVRKGTDGFMSESGMLGTASTGDYSNADLAANFAGFLFYRNLTEPIRLKGVLRPPMARREGPYWVLSSHVRSDSDFFAWFISDHLDEALNPGWFDPYLRPGLRQAVKEQVASILFRYRGAGTGRPGFFDHKLRELMNYWGTDYGHRGLPEELVTISNCCDSIQGEVLPQRMSLARQSVVYLSAGQMPVPRDGPSPVDRDEFGRTPLHEAAARGDQVFVGRLLSGGAEVDTEDAYGTTPLHLACRRGHAGVVQLFLARGANVNAMSKAGATPLHEAAACGDADVARMLLAHGARADARDRRGRTPAAVAEADGHPALANLLRVRVR